MREKPEDLADLLRLWREGRPQARAKDPGLCASIGRRILERGEPLLAFDLVSEGLKARPNDPNLLRLLALSLARSGATSRSCQILTALYRRGHRDEETLGILARTHKDQAIMAASPKLREAEMGLALRFYLSSYRAKRGYYAGINAAATALLLGRRDMARRLAREVQERCLARAQRKADEQSYWLAATLGECALILNDGAQARLWYGRAARLGRGRWSDIASTRRQARLIAERLGTDLSAVEKCLWVPRVVVFTGHRIDAPGRHVPRFPPSAEGPVRSQLARRLELIDAGFGYASAACGSDIIFLEEMLKRGGEIHIVLPCAPQEFRKESVGSAGRVEWERRFDRLLRRAVRVHVASDHGRAAGDLGFLYANLLIDGLARLKAASLGAEARPMAVWDGREGDGDGGTASLVGHWRRRGLAPEIIPLPGAVAPSRRRHGGGRPPAGLQRIKAVLFADVVSYSKITDPQIPVFMRRFMEVPGRLLKGWPRPPEAKATWGDALYFVFSDVENAGLFALRLSELVRRIRWADYGLPKSICFRISLHAGPVYRLKDPVTGRTVFTGAHVTSGARIEPVAPPGQIYASEGFAALCASRLVASFTCEYVGEVPLAKKFATWPLYHVRRCAGARTP